MHLTTAAFALATLCSLSTSTAQAIIAQNSGLANPTFQGLRLDLIGGNVTFVPLNAMQLVVGP